MKIVLYLIRKLSYRFSMQVNQPSANNLKSLKVGDFVQYDSPTVINGHHWIWQGTVTRVTWKFVYITWTHANSPVFPGPIVETESTVTNAFTRTNCDMGISLIAPVPVVADEVAPTAPVAAPAAEIKYICPVCGQAVKQHSSPGYGTLARHGFRRGPYDNSLGCRGWQTRVKDLTPIQPAPVDQ